MGKLAELALKAFELLVKWKIIKISKAHYKKTGAIVAGLSTGFAVWQAIEFGREEWKEWQSLKSTRTVILQQVLELQRQVSLINKKDDKILRILTQRAVTRK